MKRLRLGRPSPALVISIVALVMAMGGTGYAALKLPKNSVGSKQLKKNSVTGSKVKNGSLTGADLKLSALGTVPAASNAANATHAGTADSAGNANTVNQIHESGMKTASAGQDVPILTDGPLTFSLNCKSTGATSVTSQIDVTSSESHIAIESVAIGNNPDLPASTAYQLTETVSSANATTPNVDGDGGTFSALSQTGKNYIGTATAAARVYGADCAGGVTVVN